MKKRRISSRPFSFETDVGANPHFHAREIGPVMKALIGGAYKGGVDVLGLQPNTTVPLTTASRVSHYHRSALGFAGGEKWSLMQFIPFVMLTEDTTFNDLKACKVAGIRDGKIYPYFRTTKSKHGVRRYGKMLQIVRWCGELGIRVHAHFEHPDPVYINRDAEYLCLPICQEFLQESTAVIFWEHGSDARCIPAWKKFADTYPERFFVTLTAHHLAWNEDQAFGDVRKKCKPPIKTEFDRLAFLQLIAENYQWVMLGADDAAHDVQAKHVHSGKCNCGAYTSQFLMALCAHTLEALLYTAHGRRVFQNFTSRNARKVFGLPRATRKIRLERVETKIPLSYQIANWIVEPPGAGETINCRVR